MKTLIASLTIALACFSLYYCNTHSTLTATEYDMYVFAVQWGRTMCLSGYEGCDEKVLQIPKNKISIHGLWPNKKSGAYVPDCNQGAEIEIVDDGSDIFSFLHTYWPSLNQNTNEYFWGHEFNKHGYCYSEDYKEYFEATKDVFFEKRIGDIITDIWGNQVGNYSIPYNEFTSKLTERLGGQYFTPKCKQFNGKYFLSELRLSFDLDFNYIEAKLGNSCKSGKDVVIPFADE